MAILKIDTTALADTVRKCVKEYGNEAINTLNDVVEEIAVESVTKLKKTSPNSHRKKSSPHYKSGWRYTMERGRLQTGAVIYGAKQTYRLAHLLEFGHAKRGGGRSVDPSPKDGHIAPVEKWANDEAVNRYIRRMTK